MCTDKSKKGSKIFFDLCYDQYKFDLHETDQLYQRVSFVMVLLSLLAGVAYNFSRIDIFGHIFLRVDIFIYYFAILCTILTLLTSILFAILFAIPRQRKYMNLGLMNEWQQWRQDYEDYLKKISEAHENAEGKTTALNAESIDDEMLLVITPKLA